MAQSSLSSLLERYPKDNVKYTLNVKKEGRATSIGDGGGLMCEHIPSKYYSYSLRLIAKTEKDCILASSGLVERGVRSEDIGKDVAEELLEVLSLDACVDQYLQVALKNYLIRPNSRISLLYSWHWLMVYLRSKHAN